MWETPHITPPPSQWLLQFCTRRAALTSSTRWYPRTTDLWCVCRYKRVQGWWAVLTIQDWVLIRVTKRKTNLEEDISENVTYSLRVKINYNKLKTFKLQSSLIDLHMYCCVHRLALIQLHQLCLGKKIILQPLCQLSIQLTLDLTCGKKKKSSRFDHCS